MSLSQELKLTEEQKVQLRAELLGDLRLPPPEEAPQTVQTVAEDEWLFTNISGGMLLLPDLGVLSGDRKNFTPEVLSVGETKNLKDYYSQKELRNCRSFKRAIDSGLLAKGKVSQPQTNALSRLAAQNPNGTFEDPTRNDYDKKLQDLEEKDHQEDLSTRKGYKPNEARR